MIRQYTITRTFLQRAPNREPNGCFRAESGCFNAIKQEIKGLNATTPPKRSLFLKYQQLTLYFC